MARHHHNPTGDSLLTQWKKKHRSERKGIQSGVSRSPLLIYCNSCYYGFFELMIMGTFFDHRYYRLNKLFLSFLGTWPEQSLFVRCILPFCISSWLISLIGLQIIRLLDVRYDIDRFLDVLPPIFVTLIAVAQLLNGCFNHKKFCAMLDHILSDWEHLGKSPNVEVVRKYAARGGSITKAYLGWMYLACFCYITTPLIMPVVIDFVTSSNQSRENILIFEVEYFVNPDDNYPLILAHQSFTICMSITIIISSDAFFFTMTEHACALFEVVGVNLEMIESDQSTTNACGKDNSHEMISHCVNLHREAIIFTELIESSYTACLVLVVGLCLIILSITGLQTLMHLDEPGEAIRFGSFAIAQVFHLYLNSVPGQKVMDYSQSVFNNAYSVDWYHLTPRTQRYLILIMIRSMRPCQITAGKVYIVSMENFGTVLKTSMSCFTVLSSVR